MKLKPYPEYKDSGVEWLGKVPEHWAWLPNRAIFREIKDQGHVDEPLLSVTISRGIIRQEDLLADSSKKDSSNLDKSKYKLVIPGDIAYNKMRAWQGAIGVSRHRGIISPAYIAVRLYSAHNPDYFHFLLRTPGFATEAERWSYGITSDQWSLRSEHFKMIYCCVPFRREQDIIVRFINAKMWLINRFTRNKRRMIELLQEQKQAVISDCVTGKVEVRRIVDENGNSSLRPQPYPEYKNSGVEWLGAIPKHWRLDRLKYLVPQVTVGIVIQPAQLYVPEGVPCLRSLNISSGTIKMDPIVYISPDSNALHRKSQIREGDIVVVRTGQAGTAVIVPKELDGTNCIDLLIIRKSDRISNRYLLLYLRSYAARCEVEYGSVGAIQAHYNTSTLANLLVPVPEVNEQAAILRYVDKELGLIQKASNHAQRQIDLIQEYRTRLIADVVTGKVDVRDILVEDVPEDEALEKLEDEMDESLSNDDEYVEEE